MIYFDLDGVLRDLNGAAGISPVEWNCKIGKDNLRYVPYFTENLNLLYIARPTLYLEVAEVFHKHYGITILTDQILSWRRITHLWVDEHFVCSSPSIVFSNDKLSLLREGDILVEDHPYLTDYSKVILVDMPYNRGIRLPHVRVSNTHQLFREICRRIK
jgi:hypothetical protein